MLIWCWKATQDKPNFMKSEESMIVQAQSKTGYTRNKREWWLENLVINLFVHAVGNTWLFLNMFLLDALFMIRYGILCDFLEWTLTPQMLCNFLEV
jgi:hypothetical protein